MIRHLTRGAIIAIAAVMLLLPFNKAKAGIPVGTWRAHPAYNDATKAVKAFGLIHVLSDGAYYFYDPSDQGLYTIDKTGGLADTDIARMAYCPSQDVLLLVYLNGNIDLLYNNLGVYNFTELKNNSLGSVTVNGLSITGNTAYISTNIGLVLFDVKRKEIKNTYRFDASVNSSVITADSILCATDNGIYKGCVNDNLLDKTKWRLFSSDKFRDLFVFDGKLSGRTIHNVIHIIDPIDASLTHIRSYVDGLSFTDDNRLVLIQDSVISFYSTYNNCTSYTLNTHVNDVMTDGSNLWMSQGNNGLCLYQINDNDDIILKSAELKPNSPRRNWFHSVSWPENGRLLVVGGCQNYINSCFYTSFI